MEKFLVGTLVRDKSYNVKKEYVESKLFRIKDIDKDDEILPYSANLEDMYVNKDYTSWLEDDIEKVEKLNVYLDSANLEDMYVNKDYTSWLEDDIEKVEKLNVYLAAPFFSDTQVEKVNNLLNALKENDTIGEIFVPMEHQWPEGLSHDVEEFTPEWAKAVAHNDYKHVDEADIVVAIADFDGEDMDSGTAVEIGYAYANNKPVYLYHESNLDEMVNLMATEVVKAYFTDKNDVAKYDFVNGEHIPFTGNYR